MCDLPVLAHVVRGNHKRGSLRHCSRRAWPSQARQFARTRAHRANYSPDVALAARAIDSPVVALAARAGNALLSPATGRTLALITSCRILFWLIVASPLVALPPHITYHRAASSRVHPQPPPSFVPAGFSEP